MNGLSPSTGNDTRYHNHTVPSGAPILANFRPSDYYNDGSTQNIAPAPPFSAPPTPMAGTIPMNANGLYYGGLPAPPASQLPPITLPSNDNVAISNDHTAPVYNQEEAPPSNTHEAPHSGQQSVDTSPREKRHRSPSRVVRSAEHIVAIFIKWLDEYDRRSQERYDAAKTMCNDLQNDHIALRTEMKADRTDLNNNLPRLDQFNERLGECLAGTRRTQEHHDRFTRLENRMTATDFKMGEMSNRFTACETGLSHLGRRMRQFEDDRMAFVSKDTIDALEIAHTHGAESRLRIVAESIRADLTKRTENLDSIVNDVQNIDGRTAKIEESGFEAMADERISQLEKQIEELQRQRQEPFQEPVALRKNATTQTQNPLIRNEPEGMRGMTPFLMNFKPEMVQIRTIVGQLSGNHSKAMDGIHCALKVVRTRVSREITDFVCSKLKTYDPSQSQNNGLDDLISSIRSNPALSARLESKEHVQQRRQLHPTKHREGSPQIGVARVAGEPEMLSTLQREKDQVQADTRNAESRIDADDLKTPITYSTMPPPTRKALMKQRRSMTVHDSDSEDDITFKRPKTKSCTRSR